LLTQSENFRQRITAKKTNKTSILFIGSSLAIAVSADADDLDLIGIFINQKFKFNYRSFWNLCSCWNRLLADNSVGAFN